MAVSTAATANTPAGQAKGPDLKIFKDEQGETGAETAKPRAAGRDLQIHRPPAKDVSEISHFTPVLGPDDIAQHPTLQDSASVAKFLKRFDVRPDNGANFAYRCDQGNHLAVFVGNPDIGKSRAFRGLIGSWFGLTKLFTGFDPRVGLKYLKEGSIIDMVDQKQARESAASITKGIKSGEYKPVFIYEATDGKHTKQPKAIAILHDYGQMLRNLEANPPAGMPAEFRDKFLAEVKKLETEEGLQGFYACNTILVNPKEGEHFKQDAHVQKTCQMIAECMPSEANLIFPRSLFGNGVPEAASKTREYTSMDWDHVENKDGKWDFNRHPITLVRSKAHGKDKIPPAFLALHQMHTMMQIGDPAKLDKDSLPKLFEAQRFNAKAIEDYDKAVAPAPAINEVQAVDKAAANKATAAAA